jgi:hypothetical protein
MAKKKRSDAGAKFREKPSRKATQAIDLMSLKKVVRLGKLPKLGHEAMKACRAIRKNAMLRRTERFWNELTRAQKEATLRDLIALREMHGADLLQAFVRMGIKNRTVRPDEIAHMSDDWLNGYFGEEVTEIFVEGMITAAQRSLETGLPVDMYWVAGDAELKVSVAESPQQVTFLLMTPPPATNTEVRTLARPEPLWVVTGRGKKVRVDQVYPTALKG